MIEMFVRRECEYVQCLRLLVDVEYTPLTQLLNLVTTRETPLHPQESLITRHFPQPPVTHRAAVINLFTSLIPWKGDEPRQYVHRFSNVLRVADPWELYTIGKVYPTLASELNLTRMQITCLQGYGHWDKENTLTLDWHYEHRHATVRQFSPYYAPDKYFWFAAVEKSASTQYGAH